MGKSPKLQIYRITSIQVLRAIAVSLVTYVHSIDLQENYGHSFQQHLFHWENFGAFGVDIFFVISGFIISYSADKYTGARSAGRFLAHRFKRVNLPYYIVTSFLLAFIVYSWYKHGIPMKLTPYKLIKSVLLLPVTDAAGWQDPILLVAWTLAFEWLFYLLYSITIITGVKKKHWLLWAMIIALVLMGMLLSNNADYRLHFISNPIILEFLAGSVIYRCYTRCRLQRRYAWCILSIGIAICLVEIVAGYGAISEAPFIQDGSLAGIRTILWGIPAACIVAGCVFLEKAGAQPFNRPKKWLLFAGNASYSIYLVQKPVFVIGCSFLYGKLGFFLPPDLAIWFQFLLATGIGLLFYASVERPLLRSI